MYLNYKINSRKKTSGSFYYFLFLVIYFLFLLYLANKVYIWEDESYSLHTSSHNLYEVITLSYNFEGQPPFYFALLSIWRLIDSSIFFARLLSVVFIGCAAYFFQRLSSLVTEKNDSRWMAVLFLLNPFTVWAALEIRLYALVILLSTISVYYFLLYYLENKNKYLYILLATTLIGLYTQYFFVFLITSFALCLFVFKDWKKCLNFCLYFIPVIVLFLPNFIFIPDQLSMAQTHLDVNTKLLFEVIRTPQDFVLALSTFHLNQAIRWIIKIPFILLFLFAFSKLINNKTSSDSFYKEILKVIILLILVCMILYIILVPSLSLIFQEKYMTITFSLFLLLFSVLKILPWKKFIYLVISLYFIALVAIKYKYPEKTFNYEKVSKYIQKVELKNEPILFFGKSILPPLQYYYKGDNPLLTLPPLKYDKDYYEERIKDTIDLNRQIDSINTKTNSYLLVTESIVSFKYKQSLTREMIQKSIKDHYQVTLDSTFNSRNSNHFLRVQRLEKEK